MIQEAALVTVSCVLFIQMGLSQEVQNRTKVHSEFLSCPKCLTFWSVMACSFILGYGIIQTIAASFISAYFALWLSLLYDFLAKLYNYCYEAISETNDTPTDAEASSDTPTDNTEATTADAVS